jgi:chaperonin GroES
MPIQFQRNELNDRPIPAAPIEMNADRVLIWPDKDPTVTYRGIIIPDGIKIPGDRELFSGRFVKQGPGMLMEDGGRFPMRTKDLKFGERVLYNRYGSQNVTLGDHKFVSVRDDAVEGVIEEG